MKTLKSIFTLAIIFSLILSTGAFAGEKFLSRDGIYISISSPEKDDDILLKVGRELEKMGWVESQSSGRLLRIFLECTDREIAAGGLRESGFWMGSTKDYLDFHQKIGGIFNKVLNQ